MAPNRSAAQHMLATCERYAMDNNIQFLTHHEPDKSKSKALYVTVHGGLVDKPAPLLLCGQALPWVEKCNHLGNTLNITASLEKDCMIKHGEFIGNAVKVRENFSFAHPVEVIKAMEKYCSVHTSDI